MNGAGFLVSACPMCKHQGALLVHQCVRQPKPGEWSVCLHCGHVLRFASAWTFNTQGELVQSMTLVDGAAALERAHPADRIAAMALLNTALTAMVDKASGFVPARQRGRA